MRIARKNIFVSQEESLFCKLSGYFFLIFSISFYFFHPVIAQAQVSPALTTGLHWLQIQLPFIPNPFEKITPYFLNEKFGFVFQSNEYFRPLAGLYRTTDGAVSWSKIISLDSTNYPIKQIYFVSKSRGYLACKTGIFETIDSGITWTKISKSISSFISVYSSGGKVYAFEGEIGNSWGPLLSTYDDGKNWDTIIRIARYPRYFGSQMTPYVLGNKENIVIAESLDALGNMHLNYSTNNGRTWSSYFMDTAGKTATTGLFCFPHCTDIIRTFDADINDVYSIVYSKNFGATWDTINQGIEMGAWITGNGCVLYFSNAATNQHNQTGPFRSLDHGKTWINFLGPDFDEIDDRDYLNMSIVGGGAVIYAGGDIYGNVWKSVDGGDGTLSADALKSSIFTFLSLYSGRTDTLFGKKCNPMIANIVFNNTSCNYAHFDKITIDGLDSTEYRTNVKHHLACENIPDTIVIKMMPTFVGVRNITIHSHFIDDEFCTIDSIFDLTLLTTSGKISRLQLAKDNITRHTAATSGSIIPIDVYYSKENYYENVDSLIFTLSFNDGMTFNHDSVASGWKEIRRELTNTNVKFILQRNDPNPPHSDSFILRAYCQATLSKEHTGIVSLDEINFNQDTTYRDCMIASLSSSDSLVIDITNNICGDSLLRNFMRTGKVIEITSIHPNPAQDEIEVDIQSKINQNMKIEVSNVLGVTEFSTMKNISEGWNKIHLSTYNMPLGVYIVRLSSNLQTLSQSFVKVR